ncbi:GNAT family N-acetyltransferase [Fusibacter sp. JL298sf-3]
MIQFRQATFEDRLQVEAWMKKQVIEAPDLEAVDEVFLAEERGRLLGATLYAYQKENRSAAEVKWLYIVPGERRQRLGDGMIRATLNQLDRAGVTEVHFCYNEALVPFYKFEAFDLTVDGNWRVELPAFFLRPCRGR